MIRLLLLLGSFFLLFVGPSLSIRAQPNNGGNDIPDKESPLVIWHFDQPNEVGLPKNLKLTESGPRPPSYPGFAKTNTAYLFTGTGLTIRETDLPKANLRFTNGDSITLEAWVRPKSLQEGAYAYLLGKGRNGNPKYSDKNQNYALRLIRQKNQAHLTFLFGTQSGKASAFHRWTSKQGFSITDNRWHHVALTYTFGNPKSIRGYIDGKSLEGTWDQGGATEKPPLTDDDDLVLGTGNGGSTNNAFQGWLDEVAIWRTALPVEVLKSRYDYVAPSPVVDRSRLPKAKVLIELCEEGMPTVNAWPDEPLQATETYHEDVFGFFDIPQKYVDTGVRGDRANPYLFRATALVNMPKGKHRILLRARGPSRLYIDGKLLLTTPFASTDSSGHGIVKDPASYLNLGPDFRFAAPGCRETWMTFESDGREHIVLLESIIGGYFGKLHRRPELGETVVGVSWQDQDSWQLMSPGTRKVPYTDEGWKAYEAERTEQYKQINTQSREKLRHQQAEYWIKRREETFRWLKETKEVPVPPLPKGYLFNNAIDHFLAETFVRVEAQKKQEKNQSVDFFKQIQPILESKCQDCHSGSAAKSKLRLDSREGALQGGRMDGAAIVPNKPSESALLSRIRSNDPDDVMPPKGTPLSEEQAKLLETWISEGASWPDFRIEEVKLTELTDDLTFLRRVTLDTVGVVPSLAEINDFRKDSSPNKRAKVIDRLLNDPRWADHWMGYWQDVLAENPNILNPTLNNTGPFRWWLYESLIDNKPMDLFVTELLRMRGSERYGGPAGFGTASQNDVPMAAKGTIISTAFLGVEMKCARCHDAPAHRSKQEELFQLGAMLSTKALKVPTTSSVPIDKIHQGSRKPLITVTLKPGSTVQAKWPFPEFCSEEVGKKLAQYPNDSRDVLAALITAPQNERFAQVIANRVWKNLMGRGVVEPIDDWEKGKATHPDLLRWLAREFVRSGYDIKQLSRLILNSHAYQRQNDPSLKEPSPIYTAPIAKRLSAEQIVDSLFLATGKPPRLEEISLDIDGQREQGNSISLGKFRRAWMLTSTSNERDRPSLSLPRIQVVVDVMQAFGWRSTRQDPTSVRESSPNVLQPAILSNGAMSTWLTRLSDDHGITEVALQTKDLDSLLDRLFLKLLTRLPTQEERDTYTQYLQDGFTSRIVPNVKIPKPEHKPEPYVTWSNQHDPNASLIRQQQAIDARKGDPPTKRLDTRWREKLEDVLWAIINSPEMIFKP